jgi:hypothetical protein
MPPSRLRHLARPVTPREARPETPGPSPPEVNFRTTRDGMSRDGYMLLVRVSSGTRTCPAGIRPSGDLGRFNLGFADIDRQDVDLARCVGARTAATRPSCTSPRRERRGDGGRRLARCVVARTAATRPSCTSPCRERRGGGVGVFAQLTSVGDLHKNQFDLRRASAIANLEVISRNLDALAATAPLRQAA